MCKGVVVASFYQGLKDVRAFLAVEATQQLHAAIVQRSGQIRAGNFR
jgi:hypothetical protein